MKVTRRLSDYVDRRYPNWDVSIALRYLPIVDHINSKSSKAKILEVGSGEFGIAAYAPKRHEITATDIDFGKRRVKNVKLVKASAERLPFEDGSFFAVVCVDTLEHLPDNLREKSISEMVRVAHKHLYLAFPRGRMSSKTDAFISSYYHRTHKKRSAYLEEHLEHGLPEEDFAVKHIKKCASKLGKKVKVETWGNTNIALWTLLLLMGFSEKKLLTYVYHKLVMSLSILKHINIPPTYRVIIYSEFI